MPPKNMSAFERRREENRKANLEILGGINVPLIKKEVAPLKKLPSKRNASAPIKREPARPTRMSSRLAGSGPEGENVKRKFEEEVALEAEKQRAKKTRVNDDQSFADIAVEGRWNGAEGLKALSLRGALPGVRTFGDDDIRETTDKGLKALRERMSGLELYEKWAPNEIKLAPQRIYSMGFHPTEDKPLIFAGDKEGAMGIFDASQDGPGPEDDEEDAERPDPVILAFKTHARTITSFVFSPTDANTVYSGSYDSSIRKLDLQKGVSVQVYAPADDEEVAISALEMPSNDPNLLFFSSLQGQLGRHDLRNPKSNVLWQVHDQKIGGFSLHPAAPHLVATASLDRTVKIWDLRKIVKDQETKSRRPELVGQHDSRLSVSHASWSAAGDLATSSYDDTVKIYSFPDATSWKVGRTVDEAGMEPKHKVPHNNQTGRWVTILKPQWQRRPADGIQKFVIGNMNRFVDVYTASGEQLAQLGSELITAVPAVAHFHPTMDWVAGGNASGKLCLWM